MSSMGKRAFLIPILLACSASASAQVPSTVLADLAAAAAAAGNSISYSISEWRQLRQGGNFRFSDYARFLNYNNGWPAESSLRAAAEKAMQPGENATLVLGFYRLEKPKSGNGWARYADALAASSRPAEALDAARHALASEDLSPTDEASILSRFGASLTAQDYNARVDSLLFDKDATDASRLLQWTTPDRRAAFSRHLDRMYLGRHRP